MLNGCDHCLIANIESRNLCIHAKSLYRSRAGSHFYGTEYEIWVDFWPVGNTEKKIGGQLCFFMFSGDFFFEKQKLRIL